MTDNADVKAYPKPGAPDFPALEREIDAARFGDEGDLDDDALAAPVRKLGPRGPRGQAGAAAQPEEPLFE